MNANINDAAMEQASQAVAALVTTDENGNPIVPSVAAEEGKEAFVQTQETVN